MGNPAIATVRTIPDLRAQVRAWRLLGLRIGFVPTMGALHDGHITLVKAAKSRCDKVVASIFVNPTQFGPNEDFDAYPRNEAADLDRLAKAHADLAYLPTVDIMYPPGTSTTVNVTGLTEGLCGAARPGHFQGVTTVVTKLLLQVLPDAAFFGEKDYQQLKTITRMARDLDIPAEIVGVPTVREADGLALSSRNAYLTPPERAAAPALYRVMGEVAGKIAAGVEARPEEARAMEALEAAGFGPVDYVAVRDAETLEEPRGAQGPRRVLAAAWLGQTRLIDNVAVG